LRSFAVLAGAGFALIGAAVALRGSDAAAQGDPRGSDVRDCININGIDHTEVVDDDTILFHMRGREIFANDLPSSCPQLRTENRFMYRVRTSQLCDVDTVTVLTDAGFGFMEGATCRLGKFAPISEEAAEDLAGAARSRRRE
jgi:hypothetical protein